VVKLRVWRVGGQTLTSEGALREFFARLSSGSNQAPDQTTPIAEGAQPGAVESKLDALGIR
jgi:hypothetical protein